MLESWSWPKAIHGALGTSFQDLLHASNPRATASEGIETSKQRIEEMRTERKKLTTTRRLERAEDVELQVLKQILWSKGRCCTAIMECHSLGFYRVIDSSPQLPT